MTLQQIEQMTKEDRYTFMNVTCHAFQEEQSLEAYTEAIRDYIYIWRHIDEERAVYTFDSVNETVKLKAAHIKAFYEEKAPVDDAAIDVDYCCG